MKKKPIFLVSLICLGLLLSLAACGPAESDASPNPDVSPGESAAVSPSPVPDVNLSWQEEGVSYSAPFAVEENLVVCLSADVDETEEDVLREVILVHNCADGSVIQAFDVPNTLGSGQRMLELLEVEDLNFDGSPDLKFPTFDNGAPNTYYACYLWYRQDQAFTAAPSLSDLSNLSADPVSETLQSFVHSSAAESTTTIYHWVEGVLTPYSKTEVVLDGEDLVMRVYEWDQDWILISETPVEEGDLLS